MTCARPDCGKYLSWESNEIDAGRLMLDFHQIFRPKIGARYRRWQSQRKAAISTTRDFLSDLELKLLSRLRRDNDEKQEELLWRQIGFTTLPLLGDILRPHLELRTRPRLRRDMRDKVLAMLMDPTVASPLPESGSDGLGQILTLYCQCVSSCIRRRIDESRTRIVADFVSRRISSRHAHISAVREVKGLPPGPAPKRLHFCHQADWDKYCWSAANNLLRDWSRGTHTTNTTTLGFPDDSSQPTDLGCD